MPTTAESLVPLKPPVHQILLVLGEGDAHGYGVMQRVNERSEGRIVLKTGAFYRHLGKLMEAGLVAESDWRPADDDPRRGAYYRLTDRGREVLAAEGRRLARLVAWTEKLGLMPGGESV